MKHRGIIKQRHEGTGKKAIVLGKQKQKYFRGEASDAIRNLCTAEVAKTVLVDCSAKPYGGTLGWKDCK